MKIFFELNGSCEHCMMIPGPMYFVNKKCQYCLNCINANGDIAKSTYSKYRKKLDKLENLFKEQMEELKILEMNLWSNEVS